MKKNSPLHKKLVGLTHNPERATFRDCVITPPVFCFKVNTEHKYALCTAVLYFGSLFSEVRFFFNF